MNIANHFEKTLNSMIIFGLIKDDEILWLPSIKDGLRMELSIKDKQKIHH